MLLELRERIVELPKYLRINYGLAGYFGGRRENAGMSRNVTVAIALGSSSLPLARLQISKSIAHQQVNVHKAKNGGILHFLQDHQRCNASIQIFAVCRVAHNEIQAKSPASSSSSLRKRSPSSTSSLSAAATRYSSILLRLAHRSLLT